MKELIDRQFKFQKMLNVPIDTVLESDRNRLAEEYLFKLIEECIEVRKEFPSEMNRWSKFQKQADLTKVGEELADVFLFFTNLLLTWHISWEEFLDIARKKQSVNFMRVKEKKMKILNEEILNIPGYTSGVGSGNLSPKYVFIGQNPGQIQHGYKFWSDENDGASKVLLPILDQLEIRNDSYFTNLVKCSTFNNEAPNKEQVEYWTPILLQELEILRIDNPEMKIVVMGKFVEENYSGWDSSIKHPAYYLHSGKPLEEYKVQIIENLQLQSKLF